MSLEKNIKIAEMMGFQKTNLGWFDAEEILLPIKLNSNTFDNNELLFDKSWDWLMPVVKQIASIFGEWDYEDERRLKAEDIFYMDNMFAEFLQNDLEAIHTRCVEFITWYNENL
jgi:hypothetical protein